MSIEAPPKKRVRKRSARVTRGDCYLAAAKYLLDRGPENPELRLAHGEVCGQGPLSGVTYGHAWVLDGDMVIDRANGRDLRVPKALYYAIGGVDHLNNLHQYTFHETCEKLLTTKNYGPWDLKTRTGL